MLRSHACMHPQSCPTLCDPMDYIACQAPLPMEFFQARILEWDSTFLHQGIFLIQRSISCISRKILYHGTTCEACYSTKIGQRLDLAQ